jgi:hypothetical protein
MAKKKAAPADRAADRHRGHPKMIRLRDSEMELVQSAIDKLMFPTFASFAVRALMNEARRVLESPDDQR